MCGYHSPQRSMFFFFFCDIQTLSAALCVGKREEWFVVIVGQSTAVLPPPPPPSSPLRTFRRIKMQKLYFNRDLTLRVTPGNAWMDTRSTRDSSMPSHSSAAGSSRCRRFSHFVGVNGRGRLTTNTIDTRGLTAREGRRGAEV